MANRPTLARPLMSATLPCPTCGGHVADLEDAHVALAPGTLEGLATAKLAYHAACCPGGCDTPEAHFEQVLDDGAAW